METTVAAVPAVIAPKGRCATGDNVVRPTARTKPAGRMVAAVPVVIVSRGKPVRNSNVITWEEGLAMAIVRANRNQKSVGVM